MRNKFIEGHHTLIIPPDKIQCFIDDDLGNIYHRKNLCLKIFKNPYRHHIEMKDVLWGMRDNKFRENLIECTKIQNLLAFQGLSPRVYDLIFLEFDKYKYATQVTDYISSKTYCEIRQDVIHNQNKKILDYCKEVGIKPFDIGNGKNMRNGLFVDTQEFEFFDYKEGLKKRVITGLAYGGDTDRPYQSVEELGIIGKRINSEREKLLQIPKGLPNDFTVLDFGCNGGYFMRKAFDAGASYGVGVDVSRVIESAQELNNYLGYFNMEFMDTIPDIKFDLLLLLSSFSYIKPEEIFPKAKVALIEGHCLNNEHTEDHYKKMLEPYYSKITTLGWNQDNPDQPPRVVMKGER